MRKKIKKKGGFALCLHGQRAGALVIFPEIFIWHKKPNKNLFWLHCSEIAQKIKGASQRLLEHQIQRLPELMIKAKRLSSQVSLIGHNDIVEMLHGPIYIQTEKKEP
jgi:hypothetical protein